MYIEMIIIMMQICGTRQCGVHANDFHAIHHKFDSALSYHLQNVDKELAKPRLRVEFIVSWFHAHADLFVLLVRQRSDIKGRSFNNF